MPVGSMPYLTRSGLPVSTLRSQLLAQFVQRHDLLGAAADQGQLFLDLCLNGLHEVTHPFEVRKRYTAPIL